MKTDFIEASRSIRIEKRYSVVVAGGGIAGVAAAVAAAREAKRRLNRGAPGTAGQPPVALIEKACSLGGLATLGNINIYLPICDGRGRKIIGGLAEELLLLSVRGREERIPEPWRNRGGASAPQTAAGASASAAIGPGGVADGRVGRYQVAFSPAEYQLALEELCLAEGIDLFYDTRICSVHKEGDSLESLVVENKSGRFAIGGAAFVDATGDADVAFFAGVPTESLSSNVRAGWAYYAGSGAADGSAGGAASANPGAASANPGAAGDSPVRADLCDRIVVSKPFNRDASATPDDPLLFRGDRGLDVSLQLIESRKLLRLQWDGLREKNPRSELVRLSEVPGFRMTRRILGASTVDFAAAHVWLEDTVGLFPSWREGGPVWALPFSSLYASQVPNLIAAGRCISAAAAAWDLTRAIPVCSLSGEVAGLAAARLAAARLAAAGSSAAAPEPESAGSSAQAPLGPGPGFAYLDVPALRRRLVELGNVIDESSLKAIP
jgi:hypothetical protein